MNPGDEPGFSMNRCRIHESLWTRSTQKFEVVFHWAVGEPRKPKKNNDILEIANGSLTVLTLQVNCVE